MNMPKEMEARFRKALSDVVMEFIHECEADKIHGCAAVVVMNSMHLCWHLCTVINSTPEEFAAAAYKIAVAGPPDL